MPRPPGPPIAPHARGQRTGDPAPENAPRPAESRPRRSPVQRRRLALTGLVVLTVLAGGGTWAVYGSPLLRTEHVSVGGAQQLTDDQIIKAAAVPLGGSLLSVDTGAVRSRLLKALPRIEHVEVSRSWPHTVRLKITERTASAVLRIGSRFTEVDPDGVRFATVDLAPRGVPLVQLADPRPADVRQFGTKRLLHAAIVVAGDLPESLRGRATAIKVASYDGITVELSGGREVMWGSAENGSEKAAILGSLMKAQPDATYYDVSAPTAPAASGS